MSLMGHSTVFIRVITSGTSPNRDILQLAAKIGEETLSLWIKPTKSSAPLAVPEIDGLEIWEYDLYLYGRKLPSLSLRIALQFFYRFLRLPFSRTCVLVTHTEKNDLELLIQAIKKKNMKPEFKHIIKRVCNVMPIFKEDLWNSFTLVDVTMPTLVRNLLNKKYFEKESEPTAYLEFLKELFHKFIISNYQLDTYLIYPW